MRSPLRSAVASVLALAALAACGNGDAPNAGLSTGAGGPGDRDVTILAYDSFTPSKESLAALTERTGITLRIVTAGDTGEVVNRAILTKDEPLADLIWGADNTFASRLARSGVLEPYRSPELVNVDDRFIGLVPDDALTPVDYGDVCVNVDTAALAERGLPVPASLADLVAPKYRDLLVVQDPARSSPGLAFLLGSIARLGEGADGWEQWWSALRGNGVKVVSSWDVAWNTEFSGGPGKGGRPLVVSYASSPPAVVLFGPDPDATTSPVTALPETCFRQVEFAGILRGTDRPDDARAVIDFLLGDAFQAQLPLNLFVFPVRTGLELPDAFTRFAVVPEAPATMEPDRIADNRDRWIDEWTNVFG
jgi:thiamine transport system substrate-binding protein